MTAGIDRSSQILAFVLDNLQVVSYKWLSRKFSISSNESKRLLQSVAEQHGSSIDIIYAVSGWAKADHNCYSVRLVPKSKLQEAKDMLHGHISIHVYSIQPCIPKDPAELWSAEYVQSEELFKQPSELNNCLRDNRFSAVSCSSVTRKVIETTTIAGNVRVPAPKVAAPSRSSSKVAAPSSSPLKPSVVQAEVLVGQPPTSGPSKESVQGNSVVDMVSVSKGSGALGGPATKSVSGTKKKTAGSRDGALANLWGRASTKPKPVLPEPQLKAAGNTETSEQAHDYPIDSSSDEDASNFARIRRGDMKKSSKRTRRMIVDDDMSDEDNADLDGENIVSLSSPELPKEKLDNPTLSEKNGKQRDVPVRHLKGVKVHSVDVVSDKEKKPEVDVVSDKEKKPEKKVSKAEEETNKSTKAANKGATTAAPESKKRKVLKTRIDERGREVTEVVWETENPITSDGSKEENCFNSADALSHAQMVESNTSNARPLGSASAKASNAAAIQNPANKASGSKSAGKGASKDAHQGRISSFFKKKS